MKTNYNLLDKIKNPSDIKLLEYNKLNLLAKEVRRRIQENVLDVYKFNSQKKLEEGLNKYVHNYNFHLKQKT